MKKQKQRDYRKVIRPKSVKQEMCFTLRIIEMIIGWREEKLTLKISLLGGGDGKQPEQHILSLTAS